MNTKKLDKQLVQNKAVLIVTLEIGQIQPSPHSDKKLSTRKAVSNKSTSQSTPLSSTTVTPSSSDNDLLDADEVLSARSRPRSEAIGLSKSHKHVNTHAHTPSTSLSSLSSKLSPLETSTSSSPVSASRYEGHGSEAQTADSERGWVRKLTNFLTSGRQKSVAQQKLQAQADALTEALIAQDSGKLEWEDPAVEYSALDTPAEHSQLYLYVHSKDKEEPKSGCCSCCPFGR